MLRSRFLFPVNPLDGHPLDDYRCTAAMMTALIGRYGPTERGPLHRPVLFRISSLEPMDFPLALLDLPIAPHFHLPLQHASNRILELMKRPYTIERYSVLVDTIRNRLPHAAIGTDVIAGFPGAFIAILFGSSLLIEVIFSLDGLGLLGFEAALNRDYPVMFGTLYVFGLLGLVMHLITDLTYVLIDPRIDFETREV